MKKIMISEAEGFSLIEIIVALSILTLAFVGAMSAFPMGLSINQTANFNSVAAYLAQQEIETMSAKDYVDIATGTVEALHPLAASSTNSLYNFQRVTQVNYVDSNLATSTSDQGIKKIRTSVYYVDPVSKQTKSYSITILDSAK